jgi:hypothetical protein
VSDRRRITLDIKLDGHQAESETTCSWVGPYILAIVTVLPEPGLAMESTRHSSGTRASRCARRT